MNITNCSGGGPGFNGGITNGSDVLRVRYYGEDTNTTAGTVDCQGNAVARDQLVEETFYLNTDTTSGEPALYCRSSISGTGVVLVAGVESLQFLYGVDTDNNGTVDRYVPWHLVTTPTDLRDGVLSIHASLVVRSPNAVAGAQDRSNHPICALRRVFGGDSLVCTRSSRDNPHFARLAHYGTVPRCVQHQQRHRRTFRTVPRGCRNLGPPPAPVDVQGNLIPQLPVLLVMRLAHESSYIYRPERESGGGSVASCCSPH